MAKKTLALNIGASSVALAEFEVGGQGVTLLKYGIAALAAPLDSGSAETILAPALLQIVREKGIRPGPVMMAVPGQMVFPRFASIPMTGTQDRFEQQVRFEIEQNVPFPIDEMICDRQILGDTADGDKAVMIVAAKIDQIESITAAVRSVGFEPEVVDVASLALTNALRLTRTAEGGSVVVLDIGAKTTSLVILEGDRIYNRSIPYAGNYITKEIASALGCTPEEAEAFKCEHGYVSLGGVTEDSDETVECVAKVCRAAMTKLNAELTRSINFYRSQQGGSAPVKLYLTGGTSLLRQIDSFFAEALGVEVEFFNPFEGVAVGDGVDEEALGTDAAVLAPVVGLALRPAGLATCAINLLPPSILAERADASRIPFLAVGAVTLLAGLGLFWVGMSRQAESLQARGVRLQRQSDELNGYVNRIRIKQKDVDAREAEAAATRALLKSRGAVSAQLAAVRDALGSSLWIEGWQVLEQAAGQLPGARVTIRGWEDQVAKIERERAKRKAAPAEPAAAPTPDGKATPAAPVRKPTAAKEKDATTISDILEARLRALPGVDAGSVRTVGMKTINRKVDAVERRDGKFARKGVKEEKALVREFVLEVRFGKRVEGAGKTGRGGAR